MIGREWVKYFGPPPPPLLYIIATEPLSFILNAIFPGRKFTAARNIQNTHNNLLNSVTEVPGGKKTDNNQY